MGIQRTIIAHAISDNGADKDLFADALVLEADWTLGRNPLNIIQMTTASTSLQNERSIENAYTSGSDDGTPGLHPGHTPYMNPYDWGGLIMGRPTWMTDKSYPTTFSGSPSTGTLQWPMAEMYFNTRYVYAHSEFTPQQTMRGKMALYGYLYSFGPSCPAPSLGSDVSICGSTSITLNAHIETTGRSFSWYKDNVLISGADSNTLTISEAGIYEVKTDESGCIKSDKITVTGVLPNIDLGSDAEICDQTSIMLDANISKDNVSFEWKKDGAVISGATDSVYEASEAGTYTVTISANGCPSNSDEIIIASNLLPVQGDERCDAGEVALSVLETGGIYQWYDAPEGGEVLYTGTSYIPTIAESTTFYVKDVGGLSGQLGKTDAGNGDSWALGATSFLGTDKINNITVSQKITLTSVDVYVVNSGTNVSINIKQTGVTVHTQTATNLMQGKQTIQLGFELDPGEYTIDADGTNGSLIYEASGASFPYEYPGYISFTFNESWQSDWYGLFYNWQIATGNPCTRTPVEAIINSAGTGCNDPSQTIALSSGWNLVSINVDPADASVAAVFPHASIVKNSQSFYNSSQVSSLNSLTTIEAGHAYLVYNTITESVTISGIPTTNSSVLLQPGWNMLGVPVNYTSTIAVLPPETEAVKDFNSFYEEGNNMSTLSELVPGKGYFIKVSANCSIDF